MNLNISEYDGQNMIDFAKFMSQYDYMGDDIWCMDTDEYTTEQLFEAWLKEDKEN